MEEEAQEALEATAASPAAAETADYVILDATRFAIADLLADTPPPEAVLDRFSAGSQNWAGRKVSELIWEKLKGNAPSRLILRTTDPARPGVFHGPGVVVHYDALRAGSYLHRFLCGNWPNCRKPEYPWMFYASPSKNAGREGPQICRECRRAKGSQRQRDFTIRKNQARTAGKAGKPAGKATQRGRARGRPLRFRRSG